MKRLVLIIDTEAGSTFISLSEITKALPRRTRKTYRVTNVCNKSGNTLPLVGTIELMAQIGTSTSFVTFIVANQLVTSVILGCGFCDQNVEAIKPRFVILDTDDGLTVTTVRKPSKTNTEVPLPEKQTFSMMKNDLCRR